MITNGTINDPSFIRREITKRLSWLRAEIVLQIMAGQMTEQEAVTLLETELAFWQPKVSSKLEAWQA